MIRVSSNRLKVRVPKKQRYLPTKENKYVWLDMRRRSPFLNKELLRRYASKFNLGTVKQTERSTLSNSKKYFDIDPRGFRKFATNFDLIDKYKDITADEVEEFILQDIGIYINDDPNSFTKTQNLGMDSKDFEDPDDMPPIDKGLDEIGITTNDFKL